MPESIPTLVFCYDFRHQKSCDVITGLTAAGCQVVAVIAAPRIQLGNATQTAEEDQQLPHPADLCQRLQLPYFVTAHDDVEKISRVLHDTGATIAVIGGARIIVEGVIKLFEHGVINYHPGKIPETSGLDSFHWMIRHNAPPGITAHYIDARVDAGSMIEFSQLALKPDDTPETIKIGIYQQQLIVHTAIAKQLAAGHLPASTPINRPKKNKPMSSAEKTATMRQFQAWRLNWS